MNTSAEFPGHLGIPATTLGAAAIVSALKLPSIQRFITDDPALAGLPDFAPFIEPANLAEEPRLTKVDVARTVIDDCVATLLALKVLEDATAACKAAVVERMDSAAALESAALNFDSWQRDGSTLVTRAEIATSLLISERTAGALIEHSTTLVRDQRKTWEMLDSGQLSWDHAVIISQETSTLRSAGISVPSIALYEEALLEKVVGSTPPQFRDKARRLREKAHPESISARTKQAHTCRRMELERGRDGMSWLSLYLPAPTVEGIWDQTTVIARGSQRPDEERTLTQLRADVAASLLLCQSLSDNYIFTQSPVRSPGPADGVYYGGPATSTASVSGSSNSLHGSSNSLHSSSNGVPGSSDSLHGSSNRIPASSDSLCAEEPANNDSPFDAGHFVDTSDSLDSGDLLGTGVPPEGYDAAFVNDPWEHEFLSGTTGPGTIDTKMFLQEPGRTWNAAPPVVEAAPSNLEAALATSELAPPAVKGAPSPAEASTPRRTPTSSDRTLPPMPKVLPIVTIPMLSLLGLSNTPANLEGFGPISIDVAKRLMAKAPSFYRAFTDPITGEALALNPDSRRVSKKMRAFLRSQDEFCAFPGCSSKSVHADYDHIIPWALGGNTTEESVEPLCVKHHKVKHFKDDRTRAGRVRNNHSPERATMKLRGWTPTMTDSGRPAWTSPSGRYILPPDRDVQTPSYPKWLKKQINGTFKQSAARNTTGRNTGIRKTGTRDTTVGDTTIRNTSIRNTASAPEQLSGPVDVSMMETLLIAYLGD